MSLDDNHDSVVLTCAKVINAMLSYEMNEMYFDVLEVTLLIYLLICFSLRTLSLNG